MRPSTLKRFLRMPDFLEHLELHRLDCMSSNKRLDSYELARLKLDEFPDEHLKPTPLVTGADLRAAVKKLAIVILMIGTLQAQPIDQHK